MRRPRTLDPDARTADARTPGHPNAWTLDAWTPDARHRTLDTQNPWTLDAWTPDAHTADKDAGRGTSTLAASSGHLDRHGTVTARWRLDLARVATARQEAAPRRIALVCWIW